MGEAADPELVGEGFPAAGEIIALVAGLAPFLGDVGTSSTVTVDGVVQSHRALHYVALIGGVVALLMALWGLSLLGRTKPSAKGKRVVGGVVLVGLALFQLARGFGLL